MVMMQIKFNSLFYKLSDVVCQSGLLFQTGPLGFGLGSPAVKLQVFVLLCTMC